MDVKQRAVALNLSVAFLMLIGKGIAFGITGSAAIFSDWAESCLHLFAAGITSICFWYACQPADHNHPYGHDKIVYFASAAEGLFLAFAGAGIVAVALHDLYDGIAVKSLGYGAVVLAFLIAVNGALGAHLVRVGRATHDRLLVSNGKHLLADMWTTVGIVAGVLLVWWTGILWLDPVVALLVACHIFWTAGSLLKQSFEGLMEKSDPQIEQQILEQLQQGVRDGLISGYHALTHREINDRMWIEVHWTFPETLQLHEVHERACELEMRIDDAFPSRRVWLTTHFEPEEHEQHHPDAHFEVLSRGG